MSPVRFRERYWRDDYAEPPPLAPETRLNVWVDRDVLEECELLGEWIARAGCTVTQSAGDADVAMTGGSVVTDGVPYVIAVRKSADAGEMRRLLDAGFDDVVVEAFDEARLAAALVLAEVRLRHRNRGSARELGQLLDATADMVSLCTLDGSISWANRAHETILGYTPEEMVGKNGFELIHPDDAPHAATALARLRGHEPVVDTEVRMRRKDGGWVHVELSGSILPGRNPRLVVITRHLQDRMEFVRLLRESEERFRRLVELSPLTIAVHRGGKVVYINDAGASLFGLDPQSVVGMPVFEMLHPDDRAAVMAAANTIDSRQGTKFVECRVVLPGRGIRHVELASGRITYDGLASTQTVIRDITDRVLAEEAYRRSERRYRDVVESSPDAIVVHDGDRILYANPAAAQVLGAVDGESMAGRPWTDFIAGAPIGLLAGRKRRLTRTQTLTVEEPRHLVKRNLTTQLEMSFSPTQFDGRDARQVVIRDVSERRRAEQERMRLERAILETQKLESLGVMAGGIAHDFNNLLVAIMGNAGLAMIELPADSPVQAYLHEIETASQRAADLARQMLAYSGKGHFVVSWTDLGGLVEETGNLLRASLPRNVHLHYRLAPGLPRIQCDATQIRQIVMNLVINAAEAIGEREGAITVTTGEVDVLPGDHTEPGEVLEPGRHVFLDVRDTGAGMDEATRARIFEPFFTTKFTGRGLGLAAVMGIAHGHSGSIRVESEPGAGTTFRLLLPVEDAAPAVVATPAAAADGARTPGRILVVDDQESVRRVATGMLQRLGYEVVACRDGDEAVEAVAAGSPDGFVAVLLDVLIPGSGGNAILPNLRAAGLDCAVVLMSGYSEDEARESVSEGTRAGFLQKPFTLAELKVVIEDLSE